MGLVPPILAYLSTCAIETYVVYRLAKDELHQKRVAISVFAINIASWPISWLLAAPAAQSLLFANQLGLPIVYSGIVLVEVFAALFEAILLYLINKEALEFSHALKYSIAANISSFVAGALLLFAAVRIFGFST
ncbi:hypothetical protein FJZ26_05830 [Candidatus Parvarchaeota archaeon]|nr:hypothetical protein [Candidatus Parvarchaeota archaeon]